MTLKEIRKSKGLTQKECAEYIGISLRAYQNYESDCNTDTIRYRYAVQKLNEYGYVDENHGIISIEDIKKACEKVFLGKQIEFCYLFGSYAKGKQRQDSDVDLLVSTPLTGLEFFELAELLRETLKKKIDLLTLEQTDSNPELLREILKDGIKIYG